MSGGGKAVFLSYASQDAEAAKRICEVLRAAGVEVWFDQNELRGGDSWDAKIRGQIKTCGLFLPIISQRTQARPEGYFRREWRLAVDRTHDMATGVVFLVPVVIDDTKETEAAVPDDFMRFQWVRLADGSPTAEFVTQIKNLLEAPARSGSAASVPRAAAAPLGRPSPPAMRQAGPLVWMWPAAAVVVTVAGYFLWRHGRGTPPVAPPPAAATGAPTASPAGIRPDMSIAVLPFVNLSDDKDASYFANGVHDDILTALAGAQNLRVVSRTTAMKYADTKKSIGEIGQELQVTHVLEGTVRRAGDRVKVTGQLINAATDEHLWAKSYERELSDVFAIQAALAREIAQALQVIFAPEEQARLDARPTNNPVAYDLFLRARDPGLGSGQLAKSRYELAEPLLVSAVQLDPGFAEAWAELAYVHVFQYHLYMDRTPARRELATQAITRANELAPENRLVIEHYGDYFYYGFRDYDQALHQYGRLARTRPNDPVVFAAMGYIQRRQGKWMESVANLRRAAELDPANETIRSNLAGLLAAGRRHDEAIAMLQRIIETSGNEAQRLGWRIRIADLEMEKSGGDPAVVRRFLDSLTPAQRTEPIVLLQRWNWLMCGLGVDTLEDLNSRLPPDDGITRWFRNLDRALLLSVAGRPDEARKLIEDTAPRVEARLKTDPHNSALWVWKAMASANPEHEAEARRHWAMAVAYLADPNDAMETTSFRVAEISLDAWTGRTEEALAKLGKSLALPYGAQVGSSRRHLWFSPLKDLPEFQALMNDPKNRAPLF